jgi:hypothetical protein
VQFYGFISINPRFYRFINGQMPSKRLLVEKAQYGARFSQNSPPMKKENAGKPHNYCQNCIVLMAATKAQ